MVTLMEKQLAWKYQDFVLAALWLDSASADPLLGLLSQKSIYKFKFLANNMFFTGSSVVGISVGMTVG